MCTHFISSGERSCKVGVFATSNTQKNSYSLSFNNVTKAKRTFFENEVIKSVQRRLLWKSNMLSGKISVWYGMAFFLAKRNIPLLLIQYFMLSES